MPPRSTVETISWGTAPTGRGARPGEPVARVGLGAGPLLHRLGEVALELLGLGTEGLETQADARLGEHEGAVALRAQGLAEVGGAVAGRSRVHEGLEHEVLL